MTITINQYDTSTLLGLYKEVPAVSTYFRSLGFQSVMTFEDEYIDFEKIREGRKLAPLVIPTVQGRPVYSEASTTTRMKAAYLKPKDPISPGRAIKRRPGENMFAPNTMSPGARFNAIIGDILRVHRETIDRREEWMASQAFITGKLTLEGPDYPTRIVDFGRAANHTVNLTGAARWNQAGVNIMDDLQIYIDRVRRAPFGGPVNRLTVGANVIGVMLKNDSVLKQLDTQVRGTSADLNTGLRAGEYVEYIGKLGPNLELWVNSDFYELADGTAVPFLDPDTIVLSGPNIMGVRCFGAILDESAGFRALPVFPKMWSNQDPSATFVMSQSAPLTVPVNPNNTLSAKVLNAA
jgi:hypothetical protein